VTRPPLPDPDFLTISYEIAAWFTGLVRFMMFILAPVALPISWILDSLIPHEGAAISKNEVFGLVEVHRLIAQEDGRDEPFNEEEVGEWVLRPFLRSCMAKMCADGVSRPFLLV
jgi:CBS domain containing-hemolysin-like protein